MVQRSNTLLAWSRRCSTNLLRYGHKYYVKSKAYGDFIARMPGNIWGVRNNLVLALLKVRSGYRCKYT